MVRQTVIAVLLSTLFAGMTVGQTQRPPATLDDLVAEVRSMRAEMNRAASASIRAQLLAARMTLQELRLSTTAQQLANIRQQLAESRIRMAPSTDQIKPALETNSQILAPLRYTVQQEQRRTQELREEEAQLLRLIESEEGRWSEFNARLTDLERSLSQVR
jgi:hypothetical protein